MAPSVILPDAGRKPLPRAEAAAVRFAPGKPVGPPCRLALFLPPLRRTILGRAVAGTLSCAPTAGLANRCVAPQNRSKYLTPRIATLGESSAE